MQWKLVPRATWTFHSDDLEDMFHDMPIMAEWNDQYKSITKPCSYSFNNCLLGGFFYLLKEYSFINLIIKFNQEVI